MEKGSTKTLGILFVIILVVLLVAHLMAMRSAKSEFSTKEQAMTQQIAELNKNIDSLSMEKNALEIKLELDGIRMKVAENNFGMARESLNAFKVYLNKAGCKKLVELTPVFDEIDTSLLKKKEVEVKQGLDQMEGIIFGVKEELETTEKEEPV
ncbi:MAG: hypothetical protein KAH24_08800, partial [Holophagae bacterium]|nr:hypothetical protein [Holophagae bacterium]